MNSRPKQNTIEAAFLGLLIFAFVVLSVWQYKGTGEIARAEMVQMRSNLNEHAQLLCQAFDQELRNSCSLLQPNSSDGKKIDWKTVHAELLKKWIASNPRPIFKRVAFCVNYRDEVQLHGLDFLTGEIKPMPFPSEWSSIQDEIAHNAGKGWPHGIPFGGAPHSEPIPFGGAPHPESIPFGGVPHPELIPFGRIPRPERIPFRGKYPFSDSTGAIFQIPIFGGSNPGEMEWMIFELDLDYLRNTWLPELIARHLDPKGKQFTCVVVKTTANPTTIIYTSQADTASIRGTPLSIKFNRQGQEGIDLPWLPCWVLEVWRKPGVLDAAVSASRQRNFAIAVALNVLILIAGSLLVRYTRRARRLAEEQMSFVANVSHELYTPLTVIRGAAHNLQRGVVRETSKIEHYAGLIIQHAEQLTEMVEQVLAVAGAKKIRATPPHLPVSIPQVLKAAVTAAQHDTRANHCEVQIQTEPSLPIVIGDESALRRAFQNLIVNAAKHGGEGGWIGISAGTINGSIPPMVEIKIADRGAGIPQNELPEIFKPFFRGSAAQANQIRGSGLGLSLVREIVEAHGGDISANSNSGCGTVLVVRLPASTE